VGWSGGHRHLHKSRLARLVPPLHRFGERAGVRSISLPHEARGREDKKNSHQKMRRYLCRRDRAITDKRGYDLDRLRINRPKHVENQT